MPNWKSHCKFQAARSAAVVHDGLNALFSPANIPFPIQNVICDMADAPMDFSGQTVLSILGQGEG